MMDKEVHDDGVVLAQDNDMSFSEYLSELIKREHSKEDHILKKHN